MMLLRVHCTPWVLPPLGGLAWGAGRWILSTSAGAEKKTGALIGDIAAIPTGFLQQSQIQIIVGCLKFSQKRFGREAVWQNEES